MSELGVNLITKVTGTSVYCFDCAHQFTTGECDEKGLVISDNDLPDGVVVVCPSCGGTDIDAKVYIEIRCE